MANIKSAKKRARQAEGRRLRNSCIKSRAYTFIKKARKAIANGPKADAEGTVSIALREIDKIAQKGIFHKNKAARLKNRLVSHLKKLAA